jgi:hypothetical protein
VYPIAHVSILFLTQLASDGKAACERADPAPFLSRLPASALYSEARQTGGEGLVAMPNAAELEERIRRLEESRDALANHVAVLRSKEDERDRRKEADKALLPVAIVIVIIFMGVMAVLGPLKNAEWWGSTGYPSSAGKAHR